MSGIGTVISWFTPGMVACTLAPVSRKSSTSSFLPGPGGGPFWPGGGVLWGVVEAETEFTFAINLFRLLSPNGFPSNVISGLSISIDFTTTLSASNDFGGTVIATFPRLMAFGVLN